ncbi:hypothetical protein Q1695_004811 [Nippostrongylus brasiliensis]|nr:hypothetical protein Q1695_004811 [Nippostrongylus brasiliensis]
MVPRQQSSGSSQLSGGCRPIGVDEEARPNIRCFEILGEINEEKTISWGNKCTITYKIALDEVGAFAFCDVQHSFVLVRARSTASETICEIHTVYDCSSTEQTTEICASR